MVLFPLLAWLMGVLRSHSLVTSQCVVNFRYRWIQLDPKSAILQAPTPFYPLHIGSSLRGEYWTITASALSSHAG
ncbi:hypothetical protein BO71DRAFT_39311 [Aspergillus ellipticus CBS 707.79]|uniref:Secreted protein n=1 Tax=Aspergillus ellipticus CBS 707.79 TaxID=1448320 RepID=A0A319DBV2_9EURO|nr:hypothetical protein BO71DRAFT_39311 [Aspergillus ellipticus CBS 707.79]